MLPSCLINFYYSTKPVYPFTSLRESEQDMVPSRPNYEIVGLNPLHICTLFPFSCLLHPLKFTQPLHSFPAPLGRISWELIHSRILWYHIFKNFFPLASSPHPNPTAQRILCSKRDHHLRLKRWASKEGFLASANS